MRSPKSLFSNLQYSMSKPDMFCSERVKRGSLITKVRGTMAKKCRFNKF